MNQAYYRKWRPSTWDEVVGQDAIVRTLRNAVAQDKQAHAYLFSGHGEQARLPPPVFWRKR